MRTSERSPDFAARGAALSLGLGLAFLLLSLNARATGTEWRIAEPDHSWSFPSDHWPHPDFRTEWWYFTGHLESEEGQEFGFQFTIFRIGLQPGMPALDSNWATRSLWMGHASISDLSEERHVFSDVLHRAIPLLAGFGTPPDPRLAWGRGPTGTETPWTLSWNGSAFDMGMRDDRQGIALDLHTYPGKPPVFQGPNGYSRKGDEENAASLYYSFTRLDTEGWVEVGGHRFRVRGQAWMDKEIGSNQLTKGQVGWDWFSLQLEDGRDLMLYVLRRRDGSVDFARGTVVDPDGRPRYLAASDWSYEATGAWTSPRTGIRYPLGWKVRIPSESLEFEVGARIRDQENIAERSGGLSYYEGAVEVRRDGSRIGLGYVEMTGYGEGNRPPI